MKKLFGSKAKAVTPATAYEDLTGAHQQQQQPAAGHHPPPDGYVQVQQQQQRALASDPTSPVLAEYRHHHGRQEQQQQDHRDQQQQQQQQRTLRKQQQRESQIGLALTSGSDDNWEFIHNPAALHREDSAGALPNPHPPVIPSSRTSSLGSLPLPPGASPPVPAPLASPLPESVANQPPPLSPSSMPFNMLRKKPPSSNKDPPPQSNGMGGGAAAILRALDPKARSRKGSADSEIGHDSNHSNHHLDVSDVERERDSKEIDREREWRERDREIRAAEEQRRLENRDVERERERERERESRQQRQTTIRDRDREGHKERDRLQLETRDPRRRKESSRERSRSKERDGKEDKKSQWASLFSKDARQDKEREEHEAEQLGRMIGYLTAQTTIDWSMALDICERASASEMNSKQAAKSLRREFRYGEPASQLSAARLWAIMTQNCSNEFIAHTNSKKFVECLENVITSSRTSPVVRDRLVDVLGAAAFKLSVQHRDTKESGKDNLRWLWRKYRPDGAPEEGVPLASDDMLFSPTVASRPPPRQHGSFAPSPEQNRPDITSRKQSVNGVISYEEDIRRLFFECNLGKGNAQLLSEALAFAGPDDLKTKEIIIEFYNKSRASKELIETQIPWATSCAERSRAQQEAQRAQYNRNSPPPVTKEEELLADLLKANEDLTEALRIYYDIERIGVEREYEKAVREKSRLETRHVPTYQDEYLEPPGMVSSGSRSPSPSPQHLPSHALPQPPLPPQAPSLQNSNSYSSQNTNYPPSLAPPARTIRGPRSPAPPRSRSPSPARSSTPSIPGSRTHSRTSSIDGGFDPSRHTALGLAQANGKLPSPLHLESTILPVVEPPTPVVKLSEKAMGKRRFVEVEPDERLRSLDDELTNDNDSTFNSTDFNDTESPTSQRPIHYVYDASAERTKEWLKESGSHQSLE